KPVILTFDDGYADAHDAALTALQARSMSGTFYIVTGFIGKPGYMTGKDLRDLRADGMEIGAHTVTHRALSALSPDAQRDEIDRSIDTLQKSLHLTIHTFAYPVGKYTRATESILRKAGIPYAVTTHHGIATGRNDPLALPRIRMKERTDLSEVLS